VVEFALDYSCAAALLACACGESGFRGDYVRSSGVVSSTSHHDACSRWSAG